MRPSVGLGDLLVAWNAVGHAPDFLVPLARMFGLTTGTSASQPAADGLLTAATPTIATPIIAATLSINVGTPEVRPQLPPQPGVGTGVETLLEDLPSVSPLRPAWSISGTKLDAPRTFDSPSPPPLFRPERERALLATAGRRARPEGGIDIAALVGALARQTLPRGLPHREVASMRGGVQLLVDRSEWMAPFAPDLDRLIDRMRAVAGETMQLLVIPDEPPFVLFPETFDPVPWGHPAPGTAIVIVSDLGRAAQMQGKRSLQRTWVDFLSKMQAAALEPVVIVPGIRERYHATDVALRRTMLLGWDRHARVAELMQFRRSR